MTTYLKDKEYYSNLYDEGTVGRCRRTVEHYKKTAKTKDKLGQIKDRWSQVSLNLSLFFLKGERFADKETTIEKWMERGRQRDELLQTKPPTVYCPKCNQLMELGLANLETNFETEVDRVYFIFGCKSCKETRGLYANGEEYIFKGNLCPECNTKWESKHIKTAKKITTHNLCPKCGNKETYTLDLFPKPKEKEEPDPDFAKDKLEYCLSEEEGRKYVSYKYDLKNMVRIVDEFKDHQKNKVVYEKAQNIKQLSLADLSELLNKGLKKSNYVGLSITNPQVGKDLIINFSVQDDKVGRENYESCQMLRKALVKLLGGTNWKLMSDGVSYKLGVLTGRLRGQDDKDQIYEDLKSSLI
jgi:hypothetical protein